METVTGLRAKKAGRARGAPPGKGVLREGVVWLEIDAGANTRLPAGVIVVECPAIVVVEPTDKGGEIDSWPKCITHTQGDIVELVFFAISEVIVIAVAPIEANGD